MRVNILFVSKNDNNYFRIDNQNGIARSTCLHEWTMHHQSKAGSGIRVWKWVFQIWCIMDGYSSDVPPDFV